MPHGEQYIRVAAYTSSDGEGLIAASARGFG
jgi:hypothetical protein